MRVIFMGSPDFSVTALKALHDAGHEIVAVYSQPPRPKGRGQEVEKTPVHQAAEAMGFMVRTPPSLKPQEEVDAFVALNADVAVVAAYGLILRENILNAPRLGCINIHASILPRWRGAAPIQRAIQAGDAETGITIMQMDKGLDTGAMLKIGTTPIAADDTAETVHDRLSDIGGTMIVGVLADMPSPTAQPEEGITYAHKLSKDESNIDWTQDAAVLERTLRAFTPWPGMTMQYKGEKLRIHKAEIVDQSGPAGQLIAEPFIVACGSKALSILELQRAGKTRQPIDAFRRGFNVTIGDRLDS